MKTLDERLKKKYLDRLEAYKELYPNSYEAIVLSLKGKQFITDLTLGEAQKLLLFVDEDIEKIYDMFV